MWASSGLIAPPRAEPFPASLRTRQGNAVNRFEVTVSALCYSILRARCPEAERSRDFPHNRTVRFVLGQRAGMPDYLRLPFAAVTLAFGLSSLLRHGKPFHRLPHAARWRQIEAWRSAPLGPCRDLIRFYESFVIFHWYSVHFGGHQAPAPSAATQQGLRMGLHEATR